jgi:dihydroflavonol-4-reductase
MSLLVTGSTGQMGSGIVEALVARGESVRGLVLPGEPTERLLSAGVEVVEGNVLDPISLRAAVEGVEGVFHAAGLVAYSPTQRAKLEAVNVEGTRNLLNACAEAGVKRLVHTSTIGALGYVEGDGEGDESTPFNWNRAKLPYFETKRASEALVLEEQRFEALAVNPGIMLGPQDRSGNGVKLLERVAGGMERWVPDGATTLANRRDIVDGHLRAFDRGGAGERYILGGTPVDWREAYRRVQAVVGGAVPTRRASPGWLGFLARLEGVRSTLVRDEPRLTPQLVEITRRNRRFSSEKAIRELGYAPLPIEVGIEACWAWRQSV